LIIAPARHYIFRAALAVTNGAEIAGAVWTAVPQRWSQ
jgi:hypothetical protein